MKRYSSYEFERALRGGEIGTVIVELGEYDYNWTMLQVVQEADTGRLWLLGGSGCSCYGLYDEVRSFADMKPLTNLTQFYSAVDKLWDGDYTPRPKSSDVSSAATLIAAHLV